MDYSLDSINIDGLKKASIDTKPFSHVVIENFFSEKIAKMLSDDFPDYESDVWLNYSNALEEKKINSHWHNFGSITYQVLSILNSGEFISVIESLFGLELFPDPGLHGGGWHIHSNGGKLNPHLDYNLHPKINLQRRLNLIIYLNENWQEEWGGSLGLWSGCIEPEKLKKQISAKFNRAVLFETENSWHGLPEPIQAPKGEYRKSLAVYYLSKPQANSEQRYKAKFSAYGEQINDPEIQELIRRRSDISTAKDVYE